MTRLEFGIALALALVFAGCLDSQPPPVDGPEATAPYVYSWSTTTPIGLDGGARIEMQPPATWCEIDTAIAGWTSDPGIDALWLWLPSETGWMYSREGDIHVRFGADDTSGWRQIWREVLGGGEVALGGGGNMTQGDVVHMLAKNLTSWAAPDGQVFPSIVIDARCDAPGLQVTYARDAIFLHERNMDDGTVVGGGAAGGIVDISVTRDARQERDLSGSVDLFAMSISRAQNNIEGKLMIDAPDIQYSWTIGPDMFRQQGPAGHYRVEVDRVAAPLVGCAEPGAPCGTYADWWGFIAGFEETDDPDAFFGLRDP